MIRERARLADQLHLTPTSGTPQSASGTAVPDWHRDLQAVSQTIRAPYFDHEVILARTRLMRAVKSAPHDLTAWRQLLTQVNADRKQAEELGGGDVEPMEMHGSMIRLIEMATKAIPRSSANRYSLEYLSIWLDLARVHEELPVDAYLARDVYKQLKLNRIGTTFSEFWESYAAFEERQGEHDKARKLRSEIAKRCHNATSTSTAKKTNPVASKSATVGGGGGDRDLQQQSQPQRLEHAFSTSHSNMKDKEKEKDKEKDKEREKENRFPNLPEPHSRSQQTPGHNATAPSRRDIHCTPPEPKRMHVASPEQIRRDASPAPYEEPDLLASEGLPPSAAAYAGTSATPGTSTQQPRNVSHSSSWKLRAQQPLHTAGSTPLPSSTGVADSSASASGMSADHHHHRRANQRNITPYSSYRERERERERSAYRRGVNSSPLPDTPQFAPPRRERGLNMDADVDRYNQHHARRQASPAGSVSGAADDMMSPVASSRRTDSSSVDGSGRGGSRRGEDEYEYDSGQQRGQAAHGQRRGEVSTLTTRSFLMDIGQDSVTVVNGKQYLILGTVGKGGSSKVFKVLNERKCILALKRVHVRTSSSNFESTFDSYANEIDLLRRLRGRPNIVYCHDSEIRKDAGLIHLVMEYGDIDLAKQLTEVSKTKKLLDENFRRVYWTQMLEAVKTIHEAKIVHGDLKPANFLIVAGTLKLIDFGIAKAIPTEDTTKIFRDVQVGTPNYMSPEALTSYDEDDERGRDGVDAMDDGSGSRGGGGSRPKYRVGRASDIWSLGCILYQMVYGKTPFAHLTNIVKKLSCIQDESYAINYPPVSDPDILAVLKGCLQRNPVKRLSIPALLDHAYLRRRSDTHPQGGGGSGRATAVEDTPPAVWESAVDQCLSRFLAPDVSPGSDEWHAMIRGIARTLPLEVSARNANLCGDDHHQQQQQQQQPHSRRGAVMMTPTTPGLTANPGTKTNGYSLSYLTNASRSIQRG